MKHLRLQFYALLACFLVAIGLPLLHSQPVAAASVAKETSCLIRWDNEAYKGTNPNAWLKKYKNAKCDKKDGANCTVKAPAVRNGTWVISCNMSAAMAKARCQQGGGGKICDNISSAWIDQCYGDFKNGASAFVDCLKAAKSAENEAGDGELPISNICQDADHCSLIDKYVNPFIALLGGLVGLAVVIGIVWGGIQYSAAGGDPQKVAAAKDKIRRALIALVTFIFFYALLQWLLPGGIL